MQQRSIPAASFSAYARAAAALRVVACVLGCGVVPSAAAQDAALHSATALRAQYQALQTQLHRSGFHRPLVLVSSDTANGAAGEIHALLDAGYAAAGPVLSEPAEWCDVLLLVINFKQCRVTRSGSGVTLGVWLGGSRMQALSDSMRIDLAYRARQKSADYLHVEFSAGEGPMGTRDYRIRLEALPVENGKTFVRFSYSFGYGRLGRVAIQAYLATLGRNKVGFSPAPPSGRAGEPARLVGGVRGIVERNTMRLYLAIESYLESLPAAPQLRFEKRIRGWYAAAERYPHQLHDVDEAEYLEMKRAENLRQRAPPARPLETPAV